ncbi:phosphopantetheine-binding protein [Nocardiopsis sp. ARC36]
MLKVSGDGGELVCHWGYDDERFDRSTVETLAERYLLVLSHFTGDVSAPLASLPDWPLIGADAPPPPSPHDGLQDDLVWDLDTDEEDRPRTPTEELVADLWRQLLDTAGGPGDEIFDLGGHSLTVARLALRLEEETGVPVPVGELFEYRTVQSQAALVDELVRRQLLDLDEDEAADALRGLV